MAIRFFYNGIKASDGKLQKAFYGMGPWVREPEDMITIYARDYSRFTSEVRDAFVIENNSDMMTDYFENDKIRVYSTHPLYSQVKAAAEVAAAKSKARSEAFTARLASMAVAA